MLLSSFTGRNRKINIARKRWMGVLQMKKKKKEMKTNHCLWSKFDVSDKLQMLEWRMKEEINIENSLKCVRLEWINFNIHWNWQDSYHDNVANEKENSVTSIVDGVVVQFRSFVRIFVRTMYCTLISFHGWFYQCHSMFNFHKFGCACKNDVAIEIHTRLKYYETKWNVRCMWNLLRADKIYTAI